MQLTLTPAIADRDNCLVLVGGSGDTAARFQPLADQLAATLPTNTICTFSLSQQGGEGVSLLDLQARELLEVMAELTSRHSFSSFDIFATSMGAYATVQLLLNPAYSSRLGHAIFFDPADYYLSARFTTSDGELTWSGHQQYSPTSPVVSDQLAGYQGTGIVDVVHLTVRNHGPDGYLSSDYTRRGQDTAGAYPRLNTRMVQNFYQVVPLANRGKYLELNHLPHGFFRDGDIPQNLSRVTKAVTDLITG